MERITLDEVDVILSLRHKGLADFFKWEPIVGYPPNTLFVSSGCLTDSTLHQHLKTWIYQDIGSTN